MKKAGNALMTLVGGRSIHPINVRLGGFYRLPAPDELQAIRPQLEQARDDALETVRTVARFDFPDFAQPHEYVALRPDGGCYPLEGCTVVTSGGRTFPAGAFDTEVVEEQVAWSNALHARLRDGGSYAVGPLARYSLNFPALSPLAQTAAREAGLDRSAATPSAPSSCARSSWCTPATRRCA